MQRTDVGTVAPAGLKRHWAAVNCNAATDASVGGAVAESTRAATPAPCAWAKKDAASRPDTDDAESKVLSIAIRPTVLAPLDSCTAAPREPGEVGPPGEWGVPASQCGRYVTVRWVIPMPVT